MKENRVKNIFPQVDIDKDIFLDVRDNVFDDQSDVYFLLEDDDGGYGKYKTTTSHIGNSFSTKKTFSVMVFLGLFLFLLLGRVFFLQIFNGGEYRVLAEGNRQRTVPVPAERGLIYDRNGVQLTKNVPKFSLALIPQDLPRDKFELDKIVSELAKLTGLTEQFIREQVEEFKSYSYESIIIQDDLDYETALSIEIGAADLPGISIERGSKRLYLNKEVSLENLETVSTTALSMSHVIGYAGKLNRAELEELHDKGYFPSDSIGKSGVEKVYEENLRGIFGAREIEVDSRGAERAVMSEEVPTPGKHLELAIDINMQAKLEELMQDMFRKRGGINKGSAVVIDPRNGEILALVSLPTFDNNDFSGGISSEKYKEYVEDENAPLFNRSIGGTYPSGSTIKPAIAAAALQERIINANTNFFSSGGLAVGPWFFPDWKAGGHGYTNVRKSIAWSVNTFYYYVGGGHEDFRGLGVSKIKEYLEKFGLNQKLGLDLPGENPGFIPSKEWKEEVLGEPWYVGDTYNLSIGQGHLLVTPLQIGVMTAAVANGGTVYKPHVVKSIVDPISNKKDPIPREKLYADIISPGYLTTVRAGMKDCVEYGSCTMLSYLPFDVAAKTGTAQWNSDKENHAWLTSFAPYNNPKIVLTVMIEEGSSGGLTAAPIVYDFYRWWNEYAGLN